MTEKVVNRVENQFKKERFSFELRVNDNIVCQRYFRINGFKYKSLNSNELLKVLRESVLLIKNDLESKSRLYTLYTAPQIFDNEQQLQEWEKNKPWEIEPFSYAILRDEDKTFFWDGNEMNAYDGYFNRADYLPCSEVMPCQIKFTFLDYEKEVFSEAWDGNDYPKFVRTNIDLSNTKNRYKSGENFSPFEASMVDIMNGNREDLIPIIINRICDVCSQDERFYDHELSFGKKTYTTRVEDDFNNKMYRLGKKLQKKTDNYFARWEA